MKGVSAKSTLGYLFGRLEAHNPDLLALLSADTREAFDDVVERILARAITVIQDGAKEYGILNERALSLLLTNLMMLAGCHAVPERYNNGHVDVIVEHLLHGRWKYLGECKIHDGFQYHVDGCSQLLGYCGGSETRTFCLDFFKTMAMYPKLGAMRAKFDEARPLKQRGATLEHAQMQGAFVTEHEHISGFFIRIVHIGCNLYVAAPDPASGAR